MYVGTIYGYCLYLLQEYTDEYKNYEILNDVQTRLFIKKTRKDNGIMDAVYNSKDGKSYPIAYEKMTNQKLQDAISAYKAFLDIAREYGADNLKNPKLKEHIQKYESTLKQYNYFDFTSIEMISMPF